MRKALIAVLAIVALIILGGFALPGTLTVEASRNMPCAPEAVFKQVNDFRNWNSWSPWMEQDATLKNTLSGPTAGVGAKQEWTSEKSGNGTQEITASVPHKEIRSRLFFKDYDSGAEAYFRFVPQGNGSKVVWGFAADPTSNPVARYVNAFLVKGALRKQYDRGLQLLEKAACS